MMKMYLFIVLLLSCGTFATAADVAKNVACHKNAWQIDVAIGGYAKRAVDGNRNGNWNSGSCTHTQMRTKPYWAVDLGKLYTVSGVSILNRVDCCGDRLKNYDIAVTESRPAAQPGYGSAEICAYRKDTHSGTINLKCYNDITGRYVLVQLRDRGVLTLCEVAVYSTGILPGGPWVEGDPLRPSNGLTATTFPAPTVTTLAPTTTTTTLAPTITTTTLAPTITTTTEATTTINNDVTDDECIQSKFATMSDSTRTLYCPTDTFMTKCVCDGKCKIDTMYRNFCRVNGEERINAKVCCGRLSGFVEYVYTHNSDLITCADGSRVRHCYGACGGLPSSKVEKKDNGCYIDGVTEEHLRRCWIGALCTLCSVNRATK